MRLVITITIAIIKRIWIKTPAILNMRPNTHKANKMRIIAHRNPNI